MQFQWPEEEVYSLPSRYSAPEAGKVRADREDLMKEVREQGFRIFPTATRQNKFGQQFQLRNGKLWNVYDDQGNRIGQTAVFDRDLITLIDSD